MTQKMNAILALLLFAAPISAQLPNAPTPHIDRAQWALLAADVASRTVDTYSTRQMLENGNHEQLLPDVISHHTATLAAYEASTVAVDYLAVRYLVRHHHPRLAKIFTAIDIAQVFPRAINNFYLPTRQK